MIANIPEAGMTTSDFFYHINPFVAKIEDAHTGLMQNIKSQDKENPGGIPFYYSPVEYFLYVSAVVSNDHIKFIGAKLISVENIPLHVLISRMKINTPEYTSTVLSFQSAMRSIIVLSIPCIRH